MDVHTHHEKKVRDMPSHIIWETGSGFSDDSTTGSDEDSETSVRFRARKTQFGHTNSSNAFHRKGAPDKQLVSTFGADIPKPPGLAYRAMSPHYVRVSEAEIRNTKPPGLVMNPKHRADLAALTHHVCYNTGTDSEFNASDNGDTYSHYVLPALAEPQLAAEWDEDPISLDLDIADGELPSLGSVNHGEAAGCKPCLFAFSKCGCANGVNCEFCHFRHKRKDKPRPCKGKRDRYKKLIAGMGLQGSEL